MIPILFLLVLLISLSIYDNFRMEPAEVMEEVRIENQVEFSTSDQGRKKVIPSLELALEQESWAEIAREYELELPEYPFNPQGEVGIFVLNGKVKYVQSLPGPENNVEIRVAVDVKDNYYHMGTVEKKEFWKERQEIRWILMDHRGEVFQEMVTEPDEKEEEKEEEKGEEI